MTTHSEDVLQSVSHVRHKKADGTLYVMPERVAWMPNGKDKITLSLKYSEIKTQKISPEGKAKIQLQLVLHTGEAPTFHFVNPAGPEIQLHDRNVVKELLQQLLPKFKEKLSKDVIDKKTILQENPDLYQLYKDLVVSQIISADEFWIQVAASKLNPKGTQGIMKSISDLISKTSLKNGQQAVGISPAFLSGVISPADGCNGIRYNINNDIVEAIFRTYPAVKRKHFENVPHKMTESEFWTRFFQSHYYHRDRVFAGASSSSGSSSKSDFFADCARHDETTMSEAARLGVDDPFVDLTTFHDDDYVDPVTSASLHTENLLPPDSSEADKESKSSKSKDRDKGKYETLSTLTNPNQALIKRFNHHSVMVLDTSLHRVQSIDKNKEKETSGVNHKDVSKDSSATEHVEKKKPEEEPEEVSKRKKQKLQDKTVYDDLELQMVNEGNDWTGVGTRPLNIWHKERYMIGPTPISTESFGGQTSVSSLCSAVNTEVEKLSQWNPDLSSSLNPVNALAALNELRPGGSLMKVNTSIELTASVPLEVQKELKNIYSAGNELLRHFWQCFPVTNERSEEKLQQMKTTLEKFQFAKLQPLEQKLQKEHYNAEVRISVASLCFILTLRVSFPITVRSSS